MKNKKILILCILCYLVLTGCAVNSEGVTDRKEPYYSVHVIDVGQGDAIFITLPNNETMLIDAGDNESGIKVVDYIEALGFNEITYLIGTHPHADHIGGIDDIIEKFSIKSFYMPQKEHTTKSFEDVLLTAIKNKVDIIPAKSDFTLLESKEVIVEFLNPLIDYGEDNNNWSVVIKMRLKDKTFLFMGDAEKKVEDLLIKNEIDIKADVIKLGHHGSTSSSTEEFLEKAKPMIAILSLGENNTYGHPHRETIEMLEKYSIPSYRTDQQGNIVFEFQDGQWKNNLNSKVFQGRDAEKGKIKGNINSKDEKIYHLPSGAYYKQVKPEVWFHTEQEALEAGFRKIKK